MSNILSIIMIFIDKHGKRNSNGSFEPCKSNNKGLFHRHTISKVLQPLNEASDRKEPGKNADKINHDSNVNFITQDDMSKINYLNTDANTSDQKDACLSYKNCICPESVDIIADLSCDYCFAEYVHVKCIHNDWNDSTYTKYAELCYHVNTVAKDNHDSYD